MNPSDWMLFLVVAILATNHVLVRLPGWERRSGLFWGVQLVNLATATWLMAVGLPDFQGSLGLMNWVLGLLFVFRILQNNAKLNQRRREAKDAKRKTEREAQERIRRALKAGEEAAELSGDAHDPPTTDPAPPTV